MEGFCGAKDKVRYMSVDQTESSCGELEAPFKGFVPARPSACDEHFSVTKGFSEARFRVGS